MTKLVQIAAVLEVRNVTASGAFYREKLGFHCGGFAGNPSVFCIVRRDDVAMFLDQSRTARPAPVNQYWAAYLYVDDVDALAAELRSKGVTILRDPVDQPYGCREIDVQDPDGHIIGFGQNRASVAGQLTRSNEYVTATDQVGRSVRMNRPDKAARSPRRVPGDGAGDQVPPAAPLRASRSSAHPAPSAPATT